MGRKIAPKKGSVTLTISENTKRYREILKQKVLLKKSSVTLIIFNKVGVHGNGGDC